MPPDYTGGPMAALFPASEILPERESQRIAPGIVLLAHRIGLREQAELLTGAREQARRLAGTPLRMHQPRWAGGTMSAFMMSVGMHWDPRTRGYVRELEGQAVPPLPEVLRGLAVTSVREAAELCQELQPWAGEGAFVPQTALINYYSDTAGMGMHQDLFEASKAPVVSISLGNATRFRVGNTEHRGKPWQDIVLCSGDVLIFGGPARDIFHGVMEILPDTSPEGLDLREGRINITVRQVELRPEMQGQR
ncbi:alpha-ketoglutarate-dependent dioxygenase AlkB [Corynebacterium kozikiae]|uniref:alpha-ketoglutarate-dependent dioxygenase AlkB n=1 Tax=Corynebacterium kozikiae TaxID=2968469 RepID=UPI00211C5D5B|nr:alpha-ketoglutarate-dependent dioxygenase AlkB [Corynebacterium sp. 76QC2CO]MCQ9343518.1 alpha-ketoglutarate-dependent dioxygenase AlkB [Corynebacterium sp. 76QC2CO]